MFLVLLWLLLPGALANLFRAVLGLPLWVGAVAGTAGGVGVTWKVLAWRRAWPTSGPLVLIQVLYLITTLGLTWRILGIPVLGGLVSVGGGDAGNHAALQMDFVTHKPNTYEGFTFFHTLTYGLRWLFGLDTFTSFRAGFFLVPVSMALALVGGLEFVAGRLWRSGRAMVAAQATLWVATIMAWPFLLLRLLHYHQSDGFYAHLFGTVPLVLTWLAYALPRSPWVRCAALAVFVVFYRYTYGLNLGDLLAAGGLLVLLEATRVSGSKYRGGVVLLGLVFLAAATYAYWRLLPLKDISGGVTPYSYARALRVQCWTVVGLLAVRFLSSREEPVERRLIDFALLFAGVNALVQQAYLGAGWHVDYYFLKYGFHAVVLLLCVGLLVISIRVGGLFQTGLARAGRWELVLAVLVAVGLFEVTRGWGRAFKIYVPSYWDRVRAEPPLPYLDALEDRDAVALARQVLREQGKSFGGYLSPSWPRTNFTNVELGWVPEDWSKTNGHWPLFVSGQVRQGPGLCVFWEASASDWEGYQRFSREENSPLADVVRGLQARPDTVCREHAAPWVASGSRTLCYRCD
nr:hypothetical protein [Archangium violaceum]